MLGSCLLLTWAVAGAVAASAGYMPEPAARFELQRRVENGTSFNGPYSTRGRDIVDSKGQKVTWAGVNWPMSGMFVCFERSIAIV